MRAVTPQWKADRLADMKRLGISKAKLSRLIKATSGGITTLFKPVTKQSRLVDPIHEVLGLPPPREAAAPADVADFLARIEESARGMGDAEKDLILDLAAKLARRG